MSTREEHPGCLSALLSLLGLSPAAPATLDFGVYQTEQSLLSRGELDFYTALREAVGEAALICPKVRMLDVISAHRTEKWQAYNNRLRSKHIDFVLCNPATLRPLLAIELDDKSHKRPERQDRDDFVNQVYAAAQLPVLHVKAAAHYDAAQLRPQLAVYLPDLIPPAPVDVKPLPEPAPLCPTHAIPMVVQTARYGQHAGKRFYGCPRYPQCTEKIPID